MLKIDISGYSGLFFISKNRSYTINDRNHKLLAYLNKLFGLFTTKKSIDRLIVAKFSYQILYKNVSKKLKIQRIDRIHGYYFFAKTL